MLRTKVFALVKSQIHTTYISRHPLYTLVRPTPLNRLTRSYVKVCGSLFKEKKDECLPPCPPPPKCPPVDPCEKPRDPCKPSPQITAKTPPECDQRVCEPPQCAYEVCQEDEDRKKIRRLVLAILLAAGALFLLWKFLPAPPPPTPPQVEVKKGKRKRCTRKIPNASSDIPNDVPYLLVGGGTASFAAFRSIKALDPTAKILMITNECDFPYMRPPLSKEMWFNEDPDKTEQLVFKQWSGSERSILYEPVEFFLSCEELMNSENGGLAVARGWKVTKIDPCGKTAYLEDGTAIKYNKCLLATGASPKNLEIIRDAPEEVQERVLLFRGIDDFMDLNDSLSVAESIAIIGGGFLGSELACSLARKAKANGLNTKICQIFKEPGNMHKVLPDYLSKWTTKKVMAEGVEVMSNSEIEDIKLLPKGAVKLILNNGKEVRVNNVVVALGVEPNTALAEQSGIEVDAECGGFLVNAELEARSNLYAAGDCSCFFDVKLGRRRVEHHDHAVVSGRVAGENMAGSCKPYLHQSMFWSDLGPDVGYEAIGIVDSCLPTVGVFAKANKNDSPKSIKDSSGARSETEAAAGPVKPGEAVDKMQTNPTEDYGKGVIFYLRDEMVVGMVLWNVFNRMNIARQVLLDERKYDDLNEVAKLFNIHDDDVD